VGFRFEEEFAEVVLLVGAAAVVTGAARGIGKAVADLLASAGANVLVADILAGNAEESAAQIRRDGGQALAFGVDIAEESAVKRMYEAAQAQFKSVDILVHCAAMFPKYPLLDITVEQWDRIQAVNLRGTMLVMREAIRHMRAGGKGAHHLRRQAAGHDGTPRFRTGVPRADEYAGMDADLPAVAVAVRDLHQ